MQLLATTKKYLHFLRQEKCKTDISVPGCGCVCYDTMICLPSSYSDSATVTSYSMNMLLLFMLPPHCYCCTEMYDAQPCALGPRLDTLCTRCNLQTYRLNPRQPLTKSEQQAATHTHTQSQSHTHTHQHPHRHIHPQTHLHPHLDPHTYTAHTPTFLSC